MILADKIIAMRKKSGWTQEELADQLGVSRQAVSKWEGAQSIPDIEKIIQMSSLFGVTTDYLLKDELEEQEPVSTCDHSPAMRRVSLEEADRYIRLRKEDAPKWAIATFMCILSPICMLLLAVLGETGLFAPGEDVGGCIGLCILLVIVAAAVAIFIHCVNREQEFKFLETEDFETEYGVEGMVRQRMKEYESTHSRRVILGTVLCILAAVPLFMAACLDNDLIAVAGLCVTLLLVACGCLAFVSAGVVWGTYERLLQEGDYSRRSKAVSQVSSTVSAVYWMVVTAIFLWYCFGPRGNGQMESGWVIWAVGGVIYGALAVVMKGINWRKR